MNDFECLINYQGNESNRINIGLRKQYPNSDILEIEKKINNALIKLEKVPNKILYRTEQSIDSFNEVSTWFFNRIGSKICFPSFLSCSLSGKWMKDHEFIFVITTIKETNAYNLKTLNPDHPESEVLFTSKSSFIISHLNKDTKSVFLIETKESTTEIIYQDSGFFAKPIRNSDQRKSLSDLDLI
jgi:hypothetical protein